MRVGQLARKYGVTIKEIISCINEVEPTNDSLHSNTKLNEQTEKFVEDHFHHSVAESMDQIVKIAEEMPEEMDQEIEEEKMYSVEIAIEEPSEELVVPEPLAEIQTPKKEEIVIETDRLLEMLESEKKSIDLDKITLIKAPKKKLEGLKVVGQIDLPEPKRKTLDTDDKNEAKSGKNVRPQSQQATDEEREKKRLEAKKKKKAYEASLNARRKERKKREAKRRKEAHYLQKIRTTPPINPKVKISVETKQEVTSMEDKPPQSETILGKIWRWLNT